MKRGRLIRISVLALLLLFAVAGVGNSASSGSQTITVAAASAINITVAGSAAIGSTLPGVCGTTSTTVSVQSNRPWNVQVRANPTSNPTAKARTGTTDMVNAFEYKLSTAGSYSTITTTYVNLYGSNQPRTPGSSSVSVGVDYQQCVDWGDDPGTYTITIDLQGLTF